MEAQGARVTSSRGSQTTVIHCLYPLATCKTLGPVARGSRGRQDGRGDPGSIRYYQEGKGVNNRLGLTVPFEASRIHLIPLPSPSRAPLARSALAGLRMRLMTDFLPRVPS